MTNILRKFLERIIHTRSNRNLRISEHQNGSMEKRSIVDNLFTLQAIIDDNKNHNKKHTSCLQMQKNALIDCG